MYLYQISDDRSNKIIDPLLHLYLIKLNSLTYIRKSRTLPGDSVDRGSLFRSLFYVCPPSGTAATNQKFRAVHSKSTTTRRKKEIERDDFRTEPISDLIRNLKNHNQSTMVKKKGKSKRTTLQDKYKIKKRTAETARKRKKQANRDAAAGVKKHKSTSTKDPGIPNSWPFKADLLKEIQRTRERQQELQAKAKEERATNLRALREHQAQGGTARTVEQLLAQAQQSQADFAAKEAFMSETDPSESRRDNSVATGQQSRRAYLRELRKVIDGSDVILQVLDARDPMNSRIHPKIEDMIRARPDKKMVLLLNKIDLVPKPVVQAWLTHLRRSVPALAVRADKIVERKTAKKNNGQDDGDDDAMSVAVSTATSSKANDVLGMEGLLQLLKNYARVHGKQKTKTTITVGIIGYPNVGKSSIINALKRTRAVGVSPRPGFTTCAQEVVLDRDVRLMDCPGVVFDDEAAWLGNCLNVDTLADPIPAVEKLLERCDQKSLLMTYKIPAFPAGDVMMFLAMVARK